MINNRTVFNVLGIYKAVKHRTYELALSPHSLRAESFAIPEVFDQRFTLDCLIALSENEGVFVRSVFDALVYVVRQTVHIVDCKGKGFRRRACVFGDLDVLLLGDRRNKPACAALFEYLNVGLAVRRFTVGIERTDFQNTVVHIRFDNVQKIHFRIVVGGTENQEIGFSA